MPERYYCDECNFEVPLGFTECPLISVQSASGKQYSFSVHPGRAVLCDACKADLFARLKAAL